jgi:type IV pilus assembly protein PilC
MTIGLLKAGSSDNPARRPRISTCQLGRRENEKASQPGLGTMTQTFSYRAQTRLGEALSGTIDAPSADDARRQIDLLQLHLLELAPAQPPRRRTTLSADDLIAFNQQLAQLTRAGLPLERGLRLVAQDLGGGRLAGAIQRLAADLESGLPIEQALEKRKGVFPTSYVRVLEAGVKSGSLPGVLLSLSHHLELTRRLRNALWRVAAYPIVVLAAMCAVLLLLSIFVVPKFQQIFQDFRVNLPAVTEFVLAAANVIPALVVAVAAACILGGPLLYLVRRRGWDGGLLDSFVLAMPLIGPIIRRSLAATWCDAVRVGVEASMDLPSAIDLASDIAPSPRVRREGQALSKVLASGGSLEAAGPLKTLFPTIPVAMVHGAKTGDLPQTMRSLSDLYQQQAESRLATLPALLSPALLLLLAIMLGFTIIALFMPLLTILGATF